MSTPKYEPEIDAGLEHFEMAGFETWFQPMNGSEQGKFIAEPSELKRQRMAIQFCLCDPDGVPTLKMDKDALQLQSRLPSKVFRELVKQCLQISGLLKEDAAGESEATLG